MERNEVQKVLVIAVLVVILVAGAQGKSSCTTALISLSPCLITGNNLTPSPSCCTQLASLVRSQPKCLCQVLNGGASSLSITIKQTQALALLTACNIQTQPVIQCNAVSPGSSPGTTVPSSPGSKNTTATDSNGSSAIRSSLPMFFVLVLLASYATASQIMVICFGLCQ